MTNTHEIEWSESDATRWNSEVAIVNGYTLEVCTDDEGPITSAFYWTVGYSDGGVIRSGWSGSVDQAKVDAVVVVPILPFDESCESPVQEVKFSCAEYVIKFTEEFDHLRVELENTETETVDSFTLGGEQTVILTSFLNKLSGS